MYLQVGEHVSEHAPHLAAEELDTGRSADAIDPNELALDAVGGAHHLEVREEGVGKFGYGSLVHADGHHGVKGLGALQRCLRSLVIVTKYYIDAFSLIDEGSEIKSW